MKLSQWHNGDVKPVHIGVYERAPFYGDCYYNYFDGELWHWGSGNIDNAYDRARHPQIHDNQFCLWRGIVK